jgi:hypothetical protein
VAIDDWRLEIADPRTEPKPILARGTGAPASNYSTESNKCIFLMTYYVSDFELVTAPKCQKQLLFSNFFG